eukprot:CAMPEP_0206238082 /NCGR_PEP_ID=MMETSP0047_2-20121206/14621_1 /ASSEMBLY_ACC=CAM_ASM_000192 /TAXON_ID=195065 /ORGANISM="Chroomonas mesostigmatica_cf, Strain CCMP1168" /LENGTH=337 /DNA_ID=CAMNT_0053662585 /DNA_START=120 /DNA_END=1133 /DNA_ORIENTATION=+
MPALGVQRAGITRYSPLSAERPLRRESPLIRSQQVLMVGKAKKKEEPLGPLQALKKSVGDFKASVSKALSSPPERAFNFLPPKLRGPAINAWSATVAGFAAYLIATPLETVKTGLQTIPGSTIKTVVTRAGLGGLFYGLGAMWWAGVPYSVVMYSTYQPIKSKVQEIVPAAGVFGAIVGASIAEVVGCLFFLPGELVSKRMMKDPTMYKSFPSAARTIISQQGIKGLYRGYMSTIIRDVPFTIIQFVMFEKLRKMVAGMKDGHVSFADSIGVGVVAALIATSATLPLDVVKSNIMTAATKQGFRAMSTTIVGKWSTSMAVYNTVREFYGMQPSEGGH